MQLYVLVVGDNKEQRLMILISVEQDIRAWKIWSWSNSLQIRYFFCFLMQCVSLFQITNE